MLPKIQVYSPHESICACIAVPVAVVTTSDVIKKKKCSTVHAQFITTSNTIIFVFAFKVVSFIF